MWLADQSDEWYPVEDAAYPDRYRLVAVKDLGTKRAPANAPKRNAIDMEKVINYNIAQRAVSLNYGKYTFHSRTFGLQDLLLGFEEIYPQLREDQELKYDQYFMDVMMR